MSLSPPIGTSTAHKRVLELIGKIAGTDAEILITGETGVGKERYARHIHDTSGRAKHNFVAINCGGMPSELFENELFGHVGGAFTGARQNSDGLVAEAESGTLFIDEVDSLPMPCQIKLLRFVQEKEYRRLGEARLRKADVRFIAATNTDLQAAVKDGRFREDLLYRLRVIPVEVPPLRDRREDIPLLLENFCDSYAKSYKLPRAVFSDLALEKLCSYSWPGNVRELENCVKYLTCVQFTRPVDPYDLPLPAAAKAEMRDPMPQHFGVTDGPFQQLKNQLVREFECAYLADALRRSNGNIAQAAAASNKPRRAFFELMRKHGLRACECLDQEADEASVPDYADKTR
ncbi:MAG: sigma-54 interaction domain-containing protein [Massilia sp.]